MLFKSLGQSVGKFKIPNSELKALLPLYKIDGFIIHCSDSDRPEHDSINVIDEWHKERGWICVGYHFFIRKNGEIENGRPISTEGAHCKGQNDHTLGICLSGKHEFNKAQFQSLRNLMLYLVNIVLPNEDYKIWPHRFFNHHKTCPNFNLQIDTDIFEKPIYPKMTSELYPQMISEKFYQESNIER